MAHIHRRTNRTWAWLATWRELENGQVVIRRRHRSGYSTRDEAQMAAQRFEAPLRAVRLGLADPEETRYQDTLAMGLDAATAEYAAYLIAKGNTPQHNSEVVTKIERLTRECQFGTVGEIHAQPVLDWINRNRQAIAASTINQHVIALRGMLNWLKDNHRLKLNALDSVPKLNENLGRKWSRRELTVEQIQRLLKVAPEPYSTIYYMAMITGLRAGALRQLKARMIDLDSATLQLPAELAKGRRADSVPLPPDLLARLRPILRHCGPEDVVLPIPEKRWMARQFDRHLAAAGIEKTDAQKRKVTFHSLKHSCGTFLAAYGVPLPVVQRILQHASIETTMRYIHARDDDRRRAVSVLAAKVSKPARPSKRPTKKKVKR